MTKWDKGLIVIILITSLVGLYFIKNTTINEGNAYVNIEVDGEFYKKITLGQNMVGKTFKIETEYGNNLIEIGENKVRVIEADCPDKLDVKQGWISTPGEVIVCLPNRLVIEIRSDGKVENEVDYISY